LPKRYNNNNNNNNKFIVTIGVGIYIAENIAFKQRDDLRPSSDNVFECIFIESLADNILIGCVYKPPDSDVSSFNSEFDNLLTAINKRKQA